MRQRVFYRKLGFDCNEAGKNISCVQGIILSFIFEMQRSGNPEKHRVVM
jgi:hypothetical protein